MASAAILWCHRELDWSGTGSEVQFSEVCVRYYRRSSRTVYMCLQFDIFICFSIFVLIFMYLQITQEEWKT